MERACAPLVSRSRGCGYTHAMPPTASPPTARSFPPPALVYAQALHTCTRAYARTSLASVCFSLLRSARRCRSLLVMYSAGRVGAVSSGARYETSLLGRLQAS